MEIYFQVARDAEAVKKACASLANSAVLGLDTETTELDPRRGELRLVQLSDGKETHVFDLLPFRQNGSGARENEALAPLRDLIANGRQTKVLHNAKFDAKWLSHHLGCELGKCFDTYLASQLIAAGEAERRHSLADVAQFFTGTELDKTEQISDWSSPELSHSQVEYAARDAAIMLPLYEQVVERLRNDGLEAVGELEFECISPIAEMELSGFYLDQGRWREQLERVRTAQAKAADELQDMLSAGVAQATLFGRAEINLDSQTQVAAALSNLGVPMPETTRAWQLQPLAEKYPVVGKLLEYRAVQKSMTSFGDNILEFIEPQTGRVHADFRQIGAPTGRFSCSNPNLQQIPHDPQYRRCFVAPEGRKLVVADYSQIELRILAEFSGDQNFINAFISGEDFHTTTAAQVFGVQPAEVTAEQRSFAKRLNFGIVYGVGASRFGLMTGLSQSAAENTMRKYFGTFRQLDAYLRESGETVIRDRIARTASGRMLKLRYDDGDRQQISAARRYGVNMPIQGTSADILKRALRLLHNSLSGTTARLVNIVHDEIIVECDADRADETAKLVENAMTEAGRSVIQKVPVVADVKVLSDWTK
jgi:DNA polymerase-1